jgi:hypothetical protein
VGDPLKIGMLAALPPWIFSGASRGNIPLCMGKILIAVGRGREEGQQLEAMTKAGQTGRGIRCSFSPPRSAETLQVQLFGAEGKELN